MQDLENLVIKKSKKTYIAEELKSVKPLGYTVLEVGDKVKYVKPLKFKDHLKEQLKDPEFKKEYDALAAEYDAIKQGIAPTHEEIMAGWRKILQQIKEEMIKKGMDPQQAEEAIDWFS